MGAGAGTGAGAGVGGRVSVGAGVGGAGAGSGGGSAGADSGCCWQPTTGITDRNRSKTTVSNIQVVRILSPPLKK